MHGQWSSVFGRLKLDRDVVCCWGVFRQENMGRLQSEMALQTLASHHTVSQLQACFTSQTATFIAWLQEQTKVRTAPYTDMWATGDTNSMRRWLPLDLLGLPEEN
jgi:hypothetical protein